ncbi:MAG: FG-GAP repeat protein [Myxococcota bacterium]
MVQTPHRRTYRHPDVDAGDGFGESVDISADGEVLVVGAPQDASSERGIDPIATNDDLPNAGAVYVFRRNADASWTEEAYIKAASPDAEARFGAGVSISPDGARLVVLTPADRGSGEGADSEPFGAIVAPAVTLFERRSDGWRETRYLRAPPGPLLERVHLARSADCIVAAGNRSVAFARVGSEWRVQPSVAPMADEARFASDCSIMVERVGRDRITTYGFDTRTLERRGLSSTTPPEGDVGSELGYRIRLSESAERLALARPQHDSMGDGAGTILILTRVGDSWNPETTLRSNEPLSSEELGHVMAMNAAGTRIVAMGDGGFFFEPRVHFWEQTDSPARWAHRGDLDLTSEVPRGSLDPSSLATDRLGNRVVVGEGRNNRVMVLE